MPVLPALLLAGALQAASAGNVTKEHRRCAVSVAGAGWSGVYFAWRLAVDLKRVSAADVCIFEATERIGGRVYSVPDAPGTESLTVDVGAYRTQTGMRLPRDLIEKGLGMATAPYSPGGADSRMLVVADPYGNNAGFATPIERMLDDLEKRGAKLSRFSKLVKLAKGPAGTTVLTIHGKRRQQEVVADTVFLNLPSVPSLEDLGGDSLPWNGADDLTKQALSAPSPLSQCKAYLAYKDAWWLTKLGREYGTFSDTYDSVNRPALAGRYHDGPVLCVDPARRGAACNNTGDPLCVKGRWRSSRRLGKGEECSGALLIAYTNGDNNCAFYHALQREQHSPYAVIRGASDPLHHALVAAHDRVVNFHKDALADAGIDPSALELPEAMLLGLWKTDSPFKPGYSSYPLWLPGQTRAEAMARSLKPVHDLNVFVANIDSQAGAGWAETTLIATEKILHKFMNVPAPTWLDGDYYYDKVVHGTYVPTEENPDSSDLPGVV